MSDVIIRDKAEYHTRTTDEMERHLSLPPWSLQTKNGVGTGDRPLRLCQFEGRQGIRASRRSLGL